MTIPQHFPRAGGLHRTAEATLAHDAAGSTPIPVLSALRRIRRVDVDVVEPFDGSPSLDVLASLNLEPGHDFGPQVVLDADDGSIVTAGPNQVFRRSPDGTWATVNTGLTTAIYAGVKAPDGTLVLVAADGTASTSGDHGETWSTVATGLSNTVRVAEVAGDGTIILVDQQGNVATSSDNAASFNTNGSLPTSETMRAGVQADDGSVVIAGLGGLVYRTADAANTWDEVASMGDVDFADLVKTDNGTLLLFGQYGVINRSTDHGQSWTGDDGGLGAWYYDFGIPLGAGIVLAYAATNDAAISHDHGRTWASLGYIPAAKFIGRAPTGGGWMIGRSDGKVTWLAHSAHANGDQLAHAGIHEHAVRLDAPGAAVIANLSAGGASQGRATVEVGFTT